MPLTVRLRGKVWHARGTIRVGKDTIPVPELSTGQSSRAGAQDVADREAARLRDERRWRWGAVAEAGRMTLSPPAELGEAEIKRGAAVLLYLFTWRSGFGNDQAVRSLREAKLDAAIVVNTSGRSCVHHAVLTAFHALAGRAAIWDSGGKTWRERREGDPA